MDDKRFKEADDIVREVRQLRMLQKAYFRNRETAQLERAKAQEKKVDEMVNAYYSQPTLFQ